MSAISRLPGYTTQLGCLAGVFCGAGIVMFDAGDQAPGLAMIALAVACWVWIVRSLTEGACRRRHERRRLKLTGARGPALEAQEDCKR